MRLNSRAWFVISLALFLVAGWVWHLGDERQRQTNSSSGSQPVAPSAGQPAGLAPSTGQRAPGQAATTNSSAGGTRPTGAASVDTSKLHPYRLSNTAQNLPSLMSSDSAVLLQNALINTTNGLQLQIPEHLRSHADPGSYVIQARGNAGRDFQKLVGNHGGELVAYIPNNAFLVRVSASQAATLASHPGVQSVLPFEPYFKFSTSLLKKAVLSEPLDEGTKIQVTVFAADINQARASLEQLGARIEFAERSPFGQILGVSPPMNGWAEIARLPSVQSLEPWHPRKFANDLARERLGVSWDTVTNENHLGLTGNGILVSVNDSGVDAGHPELAGRVFTTGTNALSMVDEVGHGTHVAGIIAGSGLLSSTLTNIPGSVAGADFRGKAPKAGIFSMYIGRRTGGLNVVPTVKDSFLQESVARTNALISNNSWAYVGDNGYTSSSASYDAAVRDALPEVGGSQPVLFVFAAGNEGEGGNNGLGGLPQSIMAPATAKNVITVGAVENLRRLTNTMILTNLTGTNVVFTTNQVYFDQSDSVDEIAGYSSRGNVGIGTEGEFGRFKPDVVAPGSFIISARSRQWTLSPESANYEAQRDINQTVAPHYRYNTGTSMAAPAITGTLALLQEFLEKQLGRPASPALLKALLINGARSIGKKYDLSPASSINYQGWGQANLSNSIPAFYAQFAGRTNGPGVLGTPETTAVPHVFLDQNSGGPGTNETGTITGHALATGESDSFEIRPTDSGKVVPMRVTLVWTDPPGNPVSGVKLVNDLDLVVSNTVTRQVFRGNFIPNGTDFNAPQETNAPPVTDLVNNVENVFIPAPLSENYVVSVVARRVNVNAVTANTNSIVQDYALVISAGDGDVTNAFRFSRFAPTLAAQVPPLISVTNGVALFNQRVGANFPLSTNLAGQTGQWNFYVFTNETLTANANTLTNGSNVAFVTFFPPNLGVPRRTEADIDLYVSTNPAITNLDPAVLASASKSTNRSGTQLVFFTNAPLGTVFYVGVKAEDQQGAEFGLYGISSDKPFTSVGSDGRQTITGYPLNVRIPDGSPEKPGAAVVIGIGTEPIMVQRARVSNLIQHESIGDLVGNLSHNDQFAVLNNHYSFADPTVTNHFFFYDDSGAGDFRSGGRPTDGPGSLTDFIGTEGSGVWLLNMVDNAPNHEGRNVEMTIQLDPMPKDSSVIEGTILANRWEDFVVNVPTDGERLIVNVAQMSGPVDVYVRYQFAPTLTEYDKAAFLLPPSGSLVYSINDQPPLKAGRYIVTLYNPNAVSVNYRLILTVERNPRAEIASLFSSADTPLAIRDDALTTSTVVVEDNRQVVRARASVRIDHPRAADMVLHLVSPAGTRILLSENRGGLESGGFGSGPLTNIVYAGFAEDTNLVVGPIKSAAPPYTTVAVTTTNEISGFEGAEARRYNKGEIVDGWTVDDVFRSTNSATGQITRSLPFVTTDPGLSIGGTNFLNLGRAKISRFLATRPGQQYRLRFYYRAAATGTINAQVILDGTLLGFVGGDRNRWQVKNVDFIAARSNTEIEISPAFNNPGMLLDRFELIETSGTIYYLPEEPLKPLEGELAFGDWRLEVLDNRTGPAAAVEPTLLSWQLQLVLSRPGVPVELIEEGQVLAGEVRGGEIRYFMVDVPRDVLTATNLAISTGDLVMFYNQNGLPDGTLVDDFVVDDLREGGEMLLLSTNSLPQLKPGQRYYLGVANFDPATTNQFSILVNFGYGPSSLIQPLVLTNGVARNATIQATNVIDYYQFQVSPNAYNTTFELIPSNGNVDLVVRKGLPVRDPLPTPTRYDYASGEPGRTREEIIVVTNSVPVALAPGTWYLGVYNMDTNAVSYSVRATEALSPFTITPLTNGVALRSATQKTAVLTNYYSFVVPEPADDFSVRFDLFDLSANADFMVKKNDIFDIDKPDLKTNAAPNGSAVFNFSSTPVNPVSGSWFLAVANPATSNVTFSIRATILTNSNPVVRTLTNGVTVTNTLFGVGPLGRMDYFRYVVPGDAKLVDFELLPVFGEMDLLIRKGTGLPETNRFDYMSGAGTGNPAQSIRIARGSAPVTLTPGEWTIAVLRQSDFPTSYTLKAVAVTEGKVKPIAPELVYREYGVLNTLDYYQISTSTNHFNAVFQVAAVEGVSGQLAMYLRKGLPLPDEANAHYTSRPGAGVSATLTLGRTSSPVPLDAGEWFLAVENKGPSPLAYNLVYSLLTGTDGGTNGVAFEVIDSPASLCVRWRSSVGGQYSVFGTTNRSGGTWEVLSPLFVASTPLSEFCLNKPTAYVDFLVREAGGGGTGTNITISPNFNLTADSFCLSWPSQPGVSYRVEGKPDLSTAAWNPVSLALTATGASTTFCVPLSNTNRFFRVIAP